MDTYTAVLYVHIVSGFSALFGGLIPMFSKKGSRLHIRGGWFYFWAMFGVMVTSSIMFSMKPDRLLFLFLIGIFSFYVAFSGVRSVKFKKLTDKAPVLDWVMAGLITISGATMIGMGLSGFLQKSPTNVSILYLVFGTVCLWQAGGDLLRFRKRAKGNPIKKTWIVFHIGKMGGAYIATLTAFFVVNGSFMPELVAWLGPGVIGGVLIARALRPFGRLRNHSTQ